MKRGNTACIPSKIAAVRRLSDELVIHCIGEMQKLAAKTRMMGW
jgi:hypothetical protein